MRAAVALAALALLAPLAAAGSAEDPEAPDPSGDAKVPGCGDLTGVWVTSDEGGNVTLHARLAACADPPEARLPEIHWAMSLATARQGYYVYATWDATDGYVMHYGTLDGSGGGRMVGRDPYAFKGGTPAELTLPLPGSLLRLAPGDELRLDDIRSGTLVSDRPETMYDVALPVKAYVQPVPPSAPAPAPATGPALEEAPLPEGATPEVAAPEPTARATPAAPALLALVAALLLRRR